MRDSIACGTGVSCRNSIAQQNASATTGATQRAASGASHANSTAMSAAYSASPAKPPTGPSANACTASPASSTHAAAIPRRARRPSLVTLRG